MAIPRVRRPYLIAALAAGLILALLIGGRAAWRLAHRFDRPPPISRQTDVTQIAGWMSVRYVARAYRVPPQVLFEALGVSPEEHGARSFDAIAARTGRSPEAVLAIVQATVAAWQEVNPPPERGAPKPERRFERWGGLLVVATRCVLTGLALPTNLVAGAGRYPLRAFLGYALVGESIWAGGLTGLGWWYGANWVALLDYLNDAFAALTALAVAAVLAVVLVRLLRASST